MKRKKFLTEFLGALGAAEIKWKDESNSYVSGTVIYKLGDPEEIQDFIWHKSESDVPCNSTLNLARLVNKQKLLSIDKIIVSRAELRDKFNAMYCVVVSEEEFTAIVESLEEVEVPMIDEGMETDFYCIHE